MADKKNSPEQKGQQINIELSGPEAQGIYSNLAIISHSNAEFVIDFTRILPGVPTAKVHSRIIMTPQHAKMMFKALGENLAKYEGVHGEIKADTPKVEDLPEFSGKTSKVN